MKRLISLSLVILFSIMLCSCELKKKEPKIEQIQAICELTTVKAYYNNVAESTKESGKKVWNILEKDREFWIEYEGVAEIGVNMEKVTMEVSGDSIYITMPNAEILRTYIVRETFNDESYKMNKDGLLDKNKITTEDQKNAVNRAQEEMQKKVAENKSLFDRAERVAKETIENYIKKINEISGTNLEIKWK